MDKALDCGHLASKPHGYGKDPDGHTTCYDCCAQQGRDQMKHDGHSRGLPLYWTGDEVTDWPGRLRFPLFPARRKSRHNIGGTRTDFWFRGPDGHIWHGYHIGHQTQIAHCRRTQQV